MGEHLKFLRGQVPYIGFRQIHYIFDCAPRLAGTRSYSIRQSLRLATNGFFSFSTFGLRLPLILGMFILGFVGIYGLVATYLVATGVTALAPGWLSIMGMIFLSIGLQLTFMGTMGVYIAKIFMEVKGRPSFFVDRFYHLNKDQSHS